MIRLERGLWAQSPTVVCMSLIISKLLLKAMGQLRHDAELFAQRTTWPNNTAWQIRCPADRRSRPWMERSLLELRPVSSNNVGVEKGTHDGKVFQRRRDRQSIIAIALPAWSQFSTTEGQSPQQNVPGARHPSKSGVPGLPGTGGPTVTRSGTTAPRGLHRGGQVEIKKKVTGLSGSKAGPTVKPTDTAK